jgi:hypothetical protein
VLVLVVEHLDALHAEQLARRAQLGLALAWQLVAPLCPFVCSVASVDWPSFVKRAVIVASPAQMQIALAAQRDSLTSFVNVTWTPCEVTGVPNFARTVSPTAFEPSAHGVSMVRSTNFTGLSRRGTRTTSNGRVITVSVTHPGAGDRTSTSDSIWSANA